ncbi:MAG: hypothetical protein ABF380_06770, partial [Akkermansiaceae bacterium]
QFFREIHEANFTHLEGVWIIIKKKRSGAFLLDIGNLAGTGPTRHMGAIAVIEPRQAMAKVSDLIDCEKTTGPKHTCQ